MQLTLPFSIEQPASPPSLVTRPPADRQEPLRVEFVRMRQARRYILRVRPDGTIRVTVPRGGSRREAQAFLDRQQRWIERERRRVREQHAPVTWQHGSEILLRGQRVVIAEQPQGQTVTIRYGDRRIEVDAGTDVRRAVEHDLRQLAREELFPRLLELAARWDLPVGRLTIRNQRSRWGSCAKNGNIALNFRLVQMPAAIRDYVLVHELMHIRQQNHSRRFWRLVEAVCPEFRAAERWLRTEGKSLF